METGTPAASKLQKENPPVYQYFALFLLLVCINTLVSKIAVISFNIAPGASSFYIVVAFMVVFTLWFGIWGAVAAYTGCFIGAGILSGIPPDVSLYWSLADLWQVLIPLLAFRVLKADPSLRSVRDVGILLVSGVFLNNLAGALWGSMSLAVGGEIPWSEINTVFYEWWLGNCIVCLLLVPPILYLVTPVIRGHNLFVRDYWH
jgi:integral membrane sensor domain MASE1